MADEIPDIVILTAPINPNDLRALVDRFFEDMVKYVVDVERRVIAVGGELQSDAEALLLEDGSTQQDTIPGVEPASASSSLRSSTSGPPRGTEAWSWRPKD